MATIGRLSRNHSAMNVESPDTTKDPQHHQPKPVKLENLSNSSLIKADELTALIKKLTLDDNEEILRRLDASKGSYLFTSDDLSKIIEVTTSIKTKISIIGLVGPRLIDPKSKTTYFTGLFRYAEEKSAVEEILKARTHALAAQQFSKTDGLKQNLSVRHIGRGSPLTGRGGPGRGGTNTSRANSNSSLVSDSSANKQKEGHSLTPNSIAHILSDEHELETTHAGFDDVLSALDDLTHRNGNRSNDGKPGNISLGPIGEDDSEDGSPNSSSNSVVDPGRTTNDCSSVESAHQSPENNKTKTKAIPLSKKNVASTSEDRKVVLNKVESSNTILTKQAPAPRISLEEKSSTTVKDNNDDLSSLSSESGNRNSVKRLSNTKMKSLSYIGTLGSPPSSNEKKKPIQVDAPIPSIKTMTKKYSEAALKTSKSRSGSKDEADHFGSSGGGGFGHHHEFIPHAATSVSERTKAISNPLLSKKPATAVSTPDSKVGKVQASYPFSPAKTPPSSSSSSPKPVNDCPKVGKLSLIYPFAKNNSPKNSPSSEKAATATSTASKVGSKVVTPAKTQPITKVTNYISSSRSLASNSSDTIDSILSNKSSKTVGGRSSTPLLRVQSAPTSRSPPAKSSSSSSSQHSLQPPSQPVLSNYVPEKAAAGGSGNFNYDLATKCAMALKLTKEEFLSLEEQGPIRIVKGIEKHSYAELVRRNFAKTYGVLVQAELEKFLAEEEFVVAFQKTQEQFFAQVRWRQVEQKKKALLF